MSSPAHIESVDTLKNLRNYLCSFAKKIAIALDEADYDVRDTFNWLKNDRYPYWKNEVRIRGEQLVKAKLELKRKQLTSRALNAHDSCIDETKAFNAAQRRFEEAQDKFQKVKSWIPQMEKASFDCRGALQSLSNFVQIDLPNRRTQIDTMIYALESYLAVAAPETGATSPLLAEESQARPVVHGDLECLFLDLRQRAFPQQQSRAASLSKLPLEHFKDIKIAAEFLDIIRKNKTDAALTYEDSLIIGRSLQVSDLIYAFHCSDNEGVKSQWLISDVAINSLTEFASVTALEFANRFPLFSEILSLPQGWIVIFKDNAVQSMCSPENQIFGNGG